MLGDQVGDHLGVGLGAELDAVGLQAALEVGEVLDDAVQHDLDAAGLVVVRVGVLLGDPAVGGPARVADAGGGRHGAVAARRPLVVGRHRLRRC